MKVITKRDLAVIQCVLAHKPHAGGVTIKRYVSTDHIAPEYVTAIVSVPDVPGEVRVEVKREDDGQWTPISVSTQKKRYQVVRHLAVSLTV